jgi:hypothetical protein
MHSRGRRQQALPILQDPPQSPLKKGDLEVGSLIAPFPRGRRQRGIPLGAQHALKGAASASIANTARSPSISLQKGDLEAKPLIAPFSRGRRQRGIPLGAQHALKGAASASIANTARYPLIPLQKGDLEAKTSIAPFSRGRRQRGIPWPNLMTATFTFPTTPLSPPEPKSFEKHDPSRKKAVVPMPQNL